MTVSKIMWVAVAGCCILALVVAAAGAAGASGPAVPGQGPVQGSGNPGSTAQTGQENGIQNYTISQTISDQAQQDTIAFDGLAFLTGDACSGTFLPPGKVADYAGFQYLRDNDPSQMGHNTDFVTRAADNVLSVLNDDQLAQLAALSQTEAPLSTEYGYMRFPLIMAFRDQLEGSIPAGSSGLDRTAVMDYSAELYEVDASISIARAETYAGVIRSLNQTQRAYLDQMKSEGMLSWPDVDASAILQNYGQGNSVAMRTYASEMFAWYAGSVEADTYFCPERQATYFGSFYLKDRPAMGNANYSISTTLTGDSGADFLNILNDTQRQEVTGLVDLQRSDLNGIVARRQAIATELRKALAGDSIDENAVRNYSAEYGELDGEISYWYATHFTDVGNSLTSGQKQDIAALRDFDNYTCSGAYLYSQFITMPQDIPTDFLFGVGTYNATAMSAWIQDQQQTTASRNPGSPGPAQGSQNRMPVEQGRSPSSGPAHGQQQAAVSSSANPIGTWFASFWHSLWGGVPAAAGTNAFTLTSDAGPDGGTMSAAYTCDGAGVTPGLSWSGAPAGTQEYALMMTTLPGDGTTLWNWVLYDIPGTTTSLVENSTGVGTLGSGSHGTVTRYDPPCSHGPGSKTYTYTLYALSGSPSLPADPDQVTGPVLTSAIAPITMGTASLNLSYTRP
jgi:phosphatidylethanolamine-binding protein (PEBP) family uncharacterized protein